MAEDLTEPRSAQAGAYAWRKMMKPEIVITPDAATLAHHAAARTVNLAREAAGTRGRFSLVLSGGSTPGALYHLLAKEPYRDQLPWQQIHLFWGDERCVPPDDPASNYRLAEESLMAYVPIPPENIHRIQGELEAAAAARSYEKGLQEYFCGPRTRFDLVLLGLGDDGHTASLFLGADALREAERLAVAVEAHYQDRPAQRVTLTLPAMNSARQVFFLVAGSAKAGIVQAVLEGPDKGLPAQQVRPTTGYLIWLLDAVAASQLRNKG
jgi:6-phosphogluconolactonase